MALERSGLTARGGGGGGGSQRQAECGGGRRVVAKVVAAGRAGRGRVWRRGLEMEEREARAGHRGHRLHRRVEQRAGRDAALSGGQRVVPQRPRLRREARRGRGGRRGLLEVHGGAGQHLVLGAGAGRNGRLLLLLLVVVVMVVMMVVVVVVVRAALLHLDKGPWPGRLHLVQAGGLEFVVARVALHEGTETGQGCGGCGRDLSAAEVHCQLGVVRVHDLRGIFRAVGLRCITGTWRRRAILGLYAGHIWRVSCALNGGAGGFSCGG